MSLEDSIFLKEMVLYVFSTKNLVNKDKIRFFYDLNGRNEKIGILRKSEGIHFGYCTILIPSSHKYDFEKLLKKWKISFQRQSILVEKA